MLFRGLKIAILICGTSFPLQAATLDPEIGEAFLGTSFNWLMMDGMAKTLPPSQDVGALSVISQLLRSDDPRGPIALKNYLARHPRDAAAFDVAGTDLLRKQDYENAVLAFSRALVLDKNAVWTRAKLGTALLLSGNLDRGEAALQTVIETDPNNPLARRYLAWVALSRDDLPTAILHSQRTLHAFDLRPGVVNQAHFDLAEMYHRAGRHGEIVALLEPAVTDGGHNLPPEFAGELNGRYFQAALAIGHVDEAAAAFDRMSAIAQPDSPQIRIALSRLRMHENRPEDAIALLTALREDYPELAANLIVDIALAEAAAGHTDTAVNRLLSLADVRGPGADLPVLAEAIAILIGAGRGDAALELAIGRIETTRAQPSHWMLAVETAMRLNMDAQAKTLAQDLVAAIPDYARGHFLLGTILFREGYSDDAEASLRQAIALEPTDPQYWMTLIGIVHGHETYDHSGHSHDGGSASRDTDSGHGEVATILREAIVQNPENPLLRKELGLLHLSDGNPSLAIIAFDAALERSPGHVPSLILGALARADTETDIETASNMIDRALLMAPSDPIALDVRGWVSLRQGDIIAAEEALTASLAASPEDGTTHYHMAVLLSETGDEEIIRGHLLAALGDDLYAHYREDATRRLTGR